MAEIHPFRGIHYNQSLLQNWSALFCPAYDIISLQQQQELYLKNEYNFVRLELGRELPQDTATDNKYRRAADTFQQWLKQGIFEVDKTPAIYLHHQYFTHGWEIYRRRGITARVRLEEWDKKVIRPHEGTMANPKSDRLSLLWALQANTSPILALFEDCGKQITGLLAEEEQRKPQMSLVKVDGEGHDVWVITDAEIVDKISANLARQPLYIADGHHRYESALNYRREKLMRSKLASGEEAFNFVMMTLVDFSDPGLVILPSHRLVRGIPKSTLDELMPKLEVFFEIKGVPMNTSSIREQVSNLLTEADGVSIILFGTNREHLFVLKLRDVSTVNQMMPYFHSDQYKKLDVSIVDHVILENLLALSRDNEQSNVDYVHDSADAINRVLAQEYQLALIFRPAKAETIKAIADAGDKMPRKSTYFYPKLPAGLVLNYLGQDEIDK